MGLSECCSGWWLNQCSSFLMAVAFILLFISNAGKLDGVEGRQIWSHGPNHGHGDHEHHHQSRSHSQHSPNHQQSHLNQQQFSSFEELLRFTENPFDNNTITNVTVPIGGTAFLRCKVRNLGERSISWISRRNWHILTSGKSTYTNDERFNLLHTDGSDEWTLQIKFLQQRDAGVYECQVSTPSGIVSILNNLIVVVPEAFILGNSEYHIEQGSNINLVCVIEKTPKPPEFVFWFHNDIMINYGSSREVTVHTEPGAKIHSRLNIRNAQISDSGNYSCKTAHAEAASIMVYVSQGDKIAAIHNKNGASRRKFLDLIDSKNYFVHIPYTNLGLTISNALIILVISLSLVHTICHINSYTIHYDNDYGNTNVNGKLYGIS